MRIFRLRLQLTTPMTHTMLETLPTSLRRAPSTESLTELVHSFYADVRADALLGPVFEAALHDRWEPHLARMVDFWSTVALGSKSFRGNVFTKHMALTGVTPDHFAAWVRLWGQHTERLFAPEVAHELQAARAQGTTAKTRLAVRIDLAPLRNGP